MSAFKRFKEKAKAQGMGLYQQIQTEAQQFTQGNTGQQYPGPPQNYPSPNPASPPATGNVGPSHYGQQSEHLHANVSGASPQPHGYNYGPMPPGGQPQVQYPPSPPQPAGYAQTYPQPPQQYREPLHATHVTNHYQHQQPSPYPGVSVGPPPANTNANATVHLPIFVPNFSEPPLPPLQLREDGNPNPVIWECPGPSRVVDYPSTWHRLPEVPDFLVCTNCYQRYIAPTPHAGSFSPTVNKLPQGTCRFNVPRITDSLWRVACQTGDLGPVKEYAAKRLGIAACPGAQGAATPETRWYEAIGGQIPDFKVCEACYEDQICGTPFKGCFQPAQGRGANSECHMHSQYLVRAVATCSKDASGTGWAQFVAAARLRLAQPSCDGTPVAEGTRSWRRPKNPRLANTLTFCEVCFLDQFGATPFVNEFEVIPPAGQGPNPSSKTARFIGTLLSSSQQDESQRICHAQTPSIMFLLNAAKIFHNFSMFLTGAATITASTPCTENGIRDATWHTLSTNNPNTPTPPNFNICHGCFAGIITPYGNAAAFFQQTAPYQGDRLCSFHPTSPNFYQYMLRLQQAFDVGVWSPFSNFVHKASHPPCPRSTLIPNLIWYGYQDCGICPQCYEQVCTGTPLASSMPIQAALVISPTMCSMYSPRMRQLYADACVKGSPNELVKFAHTRALVHANTVLRADAMRQIRNMQAMQAVHQGSLSAMYSGGQSFALAAGVTSGYAYGNSGNLGWHPTQSGVLAAQARENLRTGLAEANSPEGAMEMAALEAKWLEFE